MPWFADVGTGQSDLTWQRPGPKRTRSPVHRSVFDEVEAVRLIGHRTRLERIQRILVPVVDSLSKPTAEWASSCLRGTFDVLMRAAGVPFEHRAYEAMRRI